MQRLMTDNVKATKALKRKDIQKFQTTTYEPTENINQKYAALFPIYAHIVGLKLILLPAK